MSYELSFSEAFFYPDGEDLECYDAPLTPKPTNLFDAIALLQKQEPEDFAAACEEAQVLPDDPGAVWSLMEYARYDVNACTDLSSPVNVWLTADGMVSVNVY